MKKKKDYFYGHRRMRTKGERTANCEIREDGERVSWGRAKRRPYKLDPWGELEKRASYQKSWKMKRETQYRDDKRGQKHVLFIKDQRWWNGKIWKFEEYCREHNIPYCVKQLRHLESGWYYQREWKLVKWEQYSALKKINGKWESVPCMRPVYGYVYFPDKPPIKRTWSVCDGYQLIWWSNKDIGVQYIMNGV